MSQNAKTAVFCMSMVVLSVIMATLFYVYSGALMSVFDNSDALYIPNVIEEVFYRGGEFKDWYFGPPNYLFPDILVFFLVRLFTEDLYTVIGVFTAIQVSLYGLALRFLFGQLTTPGSANIFAGLSIYLLVWFGASSYAHFFYFFTMGHHAGIMMLSFLNIGLWIKYCRDKDQSGQEEISTIIIVMLLAFVGSLSDALYLIQCALPMSATILATAILNQSISFRKGLILSLLVSVSGWTGYKLYPHLTYQFVEYGTELGFGNIGDNTHQMLGIVGDALSKNPIFLLTLIVFVLATKRALRDILVTLWRRTGSKENQEFDGVTDTNSEQIAGPYTALLLLYASIAILCCFAFSAIAQHADIPNRYFWPFFAWPVVLFFPLSIHYLRKTHRFFTPYFIIGSFLLFFGGLYPKLEAGMRTQYYPEQVACLDQAVSQAGVDNGIAAYWDARFYQTWSRLDLNVAQYTHGLKEFRWTTSASYFRDTYDFVVLTEDPHRNDILPVDTIVQINGPPKIMKRCGYNVIYIYGKDALQTRKFVKPGDTYTWNACELPSEISACKSGSRVLKGAANKSGFLSFGPYESLPAGEYRFTVGYRSPALKSLPIGIWDVYADVSGELIELARGNLPGTDDQLDMFQATFELAKSYDGASVQVRTVKIPDHGMDLHHLKLEKLN